MGGCAPTGAPAGSTGQDGLVGGHRETWRRIRDFALALPGAFEDHPWGEAVAKVNGKVFVFLGLEDLADPAITVKLDESHEQALAVPGAAPTGYGLGRAGWVTVPLGDDAPPVEVLTDWVEESYRRVAPRRLVAQLDEASERQHVRGRTGRQA
jgi:predicted DNA-binding protein (MmcQ/YjbR family)